MPSRLLPLMLTTAILLWLAPGLAKAAWLTDYRAAQKQARAEKKPLLLDFTGSDWCPPCRQLEREVFSTPEFQKFAERNLILLRVDFPRLRKLPAAEEKQNSALAEKYALRSYPTIVVLDSRGKTLQELGYLPGGSTAWIRELSKLR